MKKEIYSYPKSSFLSTEKDTSIIVNMMMKNDRLKKMLYYTSRDCLSRPKLTEDQTLELFGKQIKLVPKLYVDNTVQNYIIVSFDNFSQNDTNPEFRDNLIEFDIICHFDQWHMKDFELRPYKIAAELDSMFDKKHLTGIGELQFAGAKIDIFNEGIDVPDVNILVFQRVTHSRRIFIQQFFQSFRHGSFLSSFAGTLLTLSYLFELHF